VSRRAIFLLGLAAVVSFTALWHGPLGAAKKLASQVETDARRTLDLYELPMIQAKLQRGPWSRRLILSGPADDFQRSELVRILDGTPGVLDVRWDPSSLPQERRPVP
jgi:hypothetical protein